MNKKIFVSIASYRDDQTIPTILDLFAKTKNIENLNLGILLQDSNETDTKVLDKYDNIKYEKYDWQDSLGACWARSQIQKCFFNQESYYFQIDSHHRFCENWDEKLLNIINNLAENKDIKKPVLTGYCQPYIPDSDYLKDSPCKLNCHPNFAVDGDLMFTPKTINGYSKLQEQKIDAIPARFLSGHFIFSYSSLCKECPYDPSLYFRGEELSLSARAYTHGYKFFHPTSSILWHEYIRKDKPKHWDNHTKNNGFMITAQHRSSKAKARVRAMLGIDHNDSLNFGIYGLGKTTTLHEYERYAGLDFKNKKVHKFAYDIKNRYPFAHVMSYDVWSEGMMIKYRVSFDNNEHIKQLLLNNPNVSILVLDKNDLLSYKKDIKDEQLRQIIDMSTIIIDSHMDGFPTKIKLQSHNSKDTIIIENINTEILNK